MAGTTNRISRTPSAVTRSAPRTSTEVLNSGPPGANIDLIDTVARHSLAAGYHVSQLPAGRGSRPRQPIAAGRALSAVASPPLGLRRGAGDSVNAMKTERTARRVSVTALTTLAGMHVAWGRGSSWPLSDRESLADAVTGRPEMPGPVACHLVAGALGTAALLVAGQPRRYPGLSRLGAAGVAGVLSVRGAAGLVGRTDLLSPGSVSSRFRRLDRLAYSPLCLALATSIAVSAARRSS
ncbi:DUF3995 domain-containing protein [Streptomyces sp. NBC_00893]|uniref:DUF3995 domain-containing protein n=1 Tax=Streptomyces sp. NBC_00893 TaxID=2975862 RepID=UPI00338E5444